MKVPKFLRLLKRKQKTESKTHPLKELVYGRGQTEEAFLGRFEKEYEQEIKNAS